MLIVGINGQLIEESDKPESKNQEISDLCAWILLGFSIFALIVEIILIFYFKCWKKNEISESTLERLS